MKIYIKGENLLAYTSGTPMRGLVKALVEQRVGDEFLIQVTHSAPIDSLVQDYFSDIEKYDNVTIEYLSQPTSIVNIKSLIGIKPHITTTDCDIYLSPGWPTYFLGSQQPSLSIIADLASVNMPQNSSLKWHGNRIFSNNLKWALNSNSRLLSISNFTKGELIQLSPKNTFKFDTLYNGIEDFWFDTKYESNDTINELSKDDYWVWWGYISNRKNIERLLTAYLSVKADNNKLPKIVFIGRVAPDMGDVKNNIDSYPQYFTLIDFQPSYILKTLVRQSCGLLFPSLYEGFGLPVIEAYSQGLPVMYSNITSLPEVGNGLGVEVDAYSVDSIKWGLQQMSSLAKDEVLTGKRKEWASNFTYKKAALKLSEIIDSLIIN